MADTKITEARFAADKLTAFDKWMNEPLVRMTISMLPASGEHKDALVMLFRSAFDAGFGCGSGSMAGSFLEAMLKNDRRTDPPR